MAALRAPLLLVSAPLLALPLLLLLALSAPPAARGVRSRVDDVNGAAQMDLEGDSTQGEEGLVVADAELNETGRFVFTAAALGSVLNIYDTVNNMASIFVTKRDVATLHKEFVTEGGVQGDLEMACETVQANLEMLDAVDDVLNKNLGFDVNGEYQCAGEGEEMRSCLARWKLSEDLEKDKDCSMELKEIFNVLHYHRSKLLVRSIALLTALSSQESGEARPASNGSVIALDRSGVQAWLQKSGLGVFPELHNKTNGRVLANLQARAVLKHYLGKTVERSDGSLATTTNEDIIKVYCAIRTATGGAPSDSPGSCAGRSLLDLHQDVKTKVDPWVQLMLKSLGGKWESAKWITKTFILALGVVPKTLVSEGFRGRFDWVKRMTTKFFEKMSSGLFAQQLMGTMRDVVKTGIQPAAGMLATSLASVVAMTYLYDQFDKMKFKNCERAKDLFISTSTWDNIKSDEATSGGEPIKGKPSSVEATDEGEGEGDDWDWDSLFVH